MPTTEMFSLVRSSEGPGAGVETVPGAESQATLDARRAMEVCNACRYCEGYCAVFPAMELRREFAAGDLNYLANLCHSCQGCYYACQYAPPHEFGINVPQALARVRNESYAAYAWPAPLAAAFRRNGLVMTFAMAGGIVGVLLLTLLLQGGTDVFSPHPVVPGRGFYDVVPYGAMVGVGTATFLFALLALGVGFGKFWRDTGGGRALSDVRSWRQALWDAATLKYLGGRGHGCNDRNENFSTGRRRLHHALAYGFLLCFASTSMGTIYDHFLHWPAPYPFFSAPVLLGTAGGFGLMVGGAGLLWAKLAGDHGPRARELLGSESGLLVLLFLLGLTGLLTLAVRATGVLGMVLTVHLGLVLALFVTLPYGKFVHGIYRLGALLRHARERPEAGGMKKVVPAPGAG